MKFSGYYISLAKRIIKKRVKEHKGDMLNGRGKKKKKTAIAKKALKENIIIYYHKTKKFANYNNI